MLKIFFLSSKYTIYLLVEFCKRDTWNMVDGQLSMPQEAAIALVRGKISIEMDNRRPFFIFYADVFEYSHSKGTIEQRGEHGGSVLVSSPRRIAPVRLFVNYRYSFTG
jgi:hypothetical protein